MADIEEPDAYEQVDWNIPLADRVDSDDPVVATVHHIPLATFRCPSGKEVAVPDGMGFYGARGNYIANAGIYFADPNPNQCKYKNPFIDLVVNGSDPYNSALNSPPKHLSRCSSYWTSMLRLGAF